MCDVDTRARAMHLIEAFGGGRGDVVQMRRDVGAFIGSPQSALPFPLSTPQFAARACRCCYYDLAIMDHRHNHHACS